MMTIDDLIRDDTFLEVLSPDAALGVAIAYILEQANIPDFTRSGYDPNSKKVLKDYMPQIRQALDNRVMADFLEVMEDYSKKPANKKFGGCISHVSHEFSKTIQSNLNFAPKQLTEAFKKAIAWELNDPLKKVEYQLLELQTLSRIPYIFKQQIIEKARQIDVNFVRPNIDQYITLMCIVRAFEQEKQYSGQKSPSPSQQ